MYPTNAPELLILSKHKQSRTLEWVLLSGTYIRNITHGYDPKSSFEHVIIRSVWSRSNTCTFQTISLDHQKRLVPEVSGPLSGPFALWKIGLDTQRGMDRRCSGWLQVFIKRVEEKDFLNYTFFEVSKPPNILTNSSLILANKKFQSLFSYKINYIPLGRISLWIRQSCWRHHPLKEHFLPPKVCVHR